MRRRLRERIGRTERRGHFCYLKEGRRTPIERERGEGGKPAGSVLVGVERKVLCAFERVCEMLVLIAYGLCDGS